MANLDPSQPSNAESMLCPTFHLYLFDCFRLHYWHIGYQVINPLQYFMYLTNYDIVCSQANKAIKNGEPCNPESSKKCKFDKPWNTTRFDWHFRFGSDGQSSGEMSWQHKLSSLIDIRPHIQFELCINC